MEALIILSIGYIVITLVVAVIALIAWDGAWDAAERRLFARITLTPWAWPLWLIYAVCHAMAPVWNDAIGKGVK